MKSKEIDPEEQVAEPVSYNKIVKYSNEFNKISLRGFERNQLNVFFAVLSQIKEKGDNEIHLSLERLLELTKWNPSNKKGFMKTLVDVVRKLAPINIIYEDSVEITLINLFSKFKINKEKQDLTVKLNDDSLYLLNDFSGKFTRWEFEEYIEFKSSYTKEFFRRMRQFSSRDKEKHKFWWEVSLEELKRLLCIPEKMAPSNIKIKVLDVIMEELGDKYQLEIDIITKSRGSGRKAVTGYKFYFFYEKYVKTVEEKITSKTQAKLQAGEKYSYTPRVSKLYKSEKFKDTYERFLSMRKDKYMTNGDLEQGIIMKKLEEVNNEQTAIKMLEYSIVGNYPNIYPINNGKKSSRTVKKEYKESTYDRLKRERDDRLKRERDDYQEPEIEDDPNDNFPF